MDDELKASVRRNMLLGLWAAEKLSFADDQAQAYAKGLALAALDTEHNDVLSKVHQDFERAGVVQSEEQILSVMEDFMLQASAQVPTAKGNSVDAAEVMLKRKLTTR